MTLKVEWPRLNWQDFWHVGTTLLDETLGINIVGKKISY